MSLNTGIALLLGLAAVLLVSLEVSRELRGGTERHAGPWGSFVSGALTTAVLLALVATLVLFHRSS
jgi:hypothetical protein